jgi:hypothetical protein
MCRYSVSIKDKNLKPGQKLLVKVKYDTGDFFGVIETEKKIEVQ